MSQERRQRDVGLATHLENDQRRGGFMLSLSTIAEDFTFFTRDGLLLPLTELDPSLLTLHVLLGMLLFLRFPIADTFQTSLTSRRIKDSGAPSHAALSPLRPEKPSQSISGCGEDMGAGPVLGGVGAEISGGGRGGSSLEDSWSMSSIGAGEVPFAAGAQSSGVHDEEEKMASTGAADGDWGELATLNSGSSTPNDESSAEDGCR